MPDPTTTEILRPSGHWVGSIDHHLIVEALTHVAIMANVRAEDVATYTDEQWADLASKAFGTGYGSVRLGVLIALDAADEQIKQSRRLRAQEPRRA